MVVKNAMYLFEVVVESVKSFVESRFLVIKSDFSDIFSLELKDPKQMYIVIPEPPPLPPEPPGKKGKKKKPKPKPKKGKKGKKGAVELPPPEPVIQSGQSVLFTSSAEFLIQTMNKYPLEISLWSKEDNLVFIGSATVPWDPVFITYLQKILQCQEPQAVAVKDNYNIFQEGTAKLMATLGIQVKLTYLTEKVTTSFRTLSEDPTNRKFLYTGMNSKTTSYICTMKTTDEDFEENGNKIENNYIKDKPKPKPIVYADYKNAPGANLTFFNDGDYCCIGHADKPPESVYKSPETCPDIDFICDYVRKIITSCNDNMRMLTPRPTVRPKVKATDIDRLCYCKETEWPQGALAEKFKAETQSGPCPICIGARGSKSGVRRSKSATFDIANIRGPCGRPDCKVARDLRAYIENLVDEDNEEFKISEVIGPCGSKSCTLAERIQEFLRHDGAFKHGSTLEGLSTQCACLQQMQDALVKRETCDSECSEECSQSGNEVEPCGGQGCPYKDRLARQQVYNVFYFTVELDDPLHPIGKASSPQSKSGTSSVSPRSPSHTARSESLVATNSSKFINCSDECPIFKASEAVSCSKSACYTGADSKKKLSESNSCVDPVCPTKEDLPSPADSDIVIKFNNINNPCCVKSCDIADRVKDFIVEGVKRKNKPEPAMKIDDPCYCDCECSFKFTDKTTYCAVCGGYECLGEDVKAQPEYAKPHPCPVYHKMYDRKYIKVNSPWPDENDAIKQDAASTKSGKTTTSKQGTITSAKPPVVARSQKNLFENNKEKKKKKKDTKKVGKFTANIDERKPASAKTTASYAITPVPKNMGWLWTAEDIPGMKPRPKWKPGAANKILVRRYRTVREGVDIIAKKKRALLQRKKKIEMKPTLVVKKTDGEYTVQMEVFKKYSKERLLHQYPYDEKPPLTYSIGKTPEEKFKIQKQRERRERRETRRKSRMLQSTFRDRCQEICLKAYNQAIGVLPAPNINNPECPCDTETMKQMSPPIDSCSCSEDGSISSSDTDGDDWIIEFTPPMAKWDAKSKHPPVLEDDECQYNYMDFKVKLLDKSGNPIPRFFKGPDGKQECSDLGGFWSPGKQWLEINKDGYIGPDNRWVPINFTGPDGVYYLSEDGFFTDNTGKTWRIGLDGYVDKDGKWAWYSKRNKGSMSTMTATTMDTKKSDKRDKKLEPPQTQLPGRVKPDPRGKLAATATKAMVGDRLGGPVIGQTAGRGAMKENVADKTKKTVSLPGGGKGRSPMVMNLATNYERRRTNLRQTDSIRYMDPKKLARYREIMQGLQIYDDLCELKPPIKTNRASNTTRRKVSPFTIDGTFCRKTLTTLPTVTSSPHSTCSFTCQPGSALIR